MRSLRHDSLGVYLLLLVISVAFPGRCAHAAASMTFQEGFNGYSGSYAHSLARDHLNPMTPGQGANPLRAYVKWDNSVLLKFTNLTGGSNPLATIPAGATITKATLRLWKDFNAGVAADNQISVYKMLKDWSTIDATQAAAGGYVDGSAFIYEHGSNDRWLEPSNSQPMNAESPLPGYFGRRVTIESTAGDVGQPVVIWGRKRDQNGVQSFVVEKSVVLNGPTAVTSTTRFGWVDGAMLGTGVPVTPIGDIIIREQGTGVEIMRIKAGATSTSVADNPDLGRSVSPVAYNEGFISLQGWYEFDVTQSLIEQVSSGNYYGWMLRHDEHPLNSGGGPYLDFPASTVVSHRPLLIVEFTGVPALEIRNLQYSVSSTTVTVTWDTYDANANTPLSASSKVIYGSLTGDYPKTATGPDGVSHSVTFDAASALNPIDGQIFLVAQSSRDGYVPAGTPELAIPAIHIGGIRTTYDANTLHIAWRSDTLGIEPHVEFGPTSSYGSSVEAEAPHVAPIKYSTYGGGKQVWIPAGAFARRSNEGGDFNFAADPYAHQTLSNAAYRFYSVDPNDAYSKDQDGQIVDNGGNQKDWWAEYQIDVNALPSGFDFQGQTWYFHARASQQFAGSDSDWLIANGDPGDLSDPLPSDSAWLAAATNTSEIPPGNDTSDRILNQLSLDSAPADAYRWLWLSNRNSGLTQVRAKQFRVDSGKAVFRIYEREASARNASIDYICWADSPGYTPTDEDCLNAADLPGPTPSESFVYEASIPNVAPGQLVHYRINADLDATISAKTNDQMFIEPTSAQPNLRVAAFQQGWNGYSGGHDNQMGVPGSGSENSPSGSSTYDTSTPAGQSIIGFSNLELPPDAVITHADLRLAGNYSAYALPTRPWIYVYQLVAQGWNDAQATWFKKNASETWSLPGALGANADIDACWLDEHAEFVFSSQGAVPTIHVFDVTNAVRNAHIAAGGGANPFTTNFRMNQKPDDDPTFSNGWDWYWGHDCPDGMVAQYTAGKYKRPVLAVYYRSALPVQKFGELRKLPYAMPVTAPNLIVTSETGAEGGTYVEAPERYGGIALDTTVQLNRWDTVNIDGAIGVPKSTGEPVLEGKTVDVTGSHELFPLGMTNRWVSGGAVTGVGLDSVGLLVKAWGIVTATGFDSETGAGFFYLDDGNQISADGGNIGIKVHSSSVFPSVGEYVVVTGIASLEKQGASLIRVLLPRDFSDVVVANP